MYNLQKYALKAQEAMAAYKASMQSLTDAEKQEILADKKQRQLSKAKKKEIKVKLRDEFLVAGVCIDMLTRVTLGMLQRLIRFRQKL